MKTLLQINIVVNYGSTGRLINEIGEMASQNGWNSFIAYGRKGKINEKGFIKIGSFIHVILHVIKTRLFDIHGFGSERSTKSLIKKIQKIRPDIIHLHNLHGYYLNIEVLFKYLASQNIPVIWTFHDCWPLTGHCVYFDAIGCDKWTIKCFKCPQRGKYPASWLLDSSKINFLNKKQLFTELKNLTIVNVSNWMQKITKLSFFSSYPSQVIYNGINTQLFKPTKDDDFLKKYEFNDDFIILGIANVWDRRKGLKYFIKLSKKLPKGYRMIIVGPTKFQQMFMPSNIIVLNRTDNIKELVLLYSRADVFINFSTEESFGLTTIEAMACGTPVIVFNVTANPELVESDTGFVVEKGDLEGILNAIEIIKKKGKSYFTKFCREVAVKKFDQNIPHFEYLNLYNSITSKSFVPVKRNINS